MLTHRIWKATCAMLLGAAIAACATRTAPLTVADTLANTPRLATMSRLVNQADLADTLRGPGPFTVFAPTDEAFNALPAATLNALMKDKVRLRAALTFSMLPARVMVADAQPGNQKTVNGASVGLSRAGAFVTFDEAIVTQADVPATNGVVHLIDKVVLPPPSR